MVCVCVFCPPLRSPKKKTQTQANRLFTGCQASEVVVVVRVGGLQRDWIATCSFFIQLFVTLILWWNFGVFLFEKNVLSPLKTHHGQRLHKRVMLEKNLKGMYSKACEIMLHLTRKIYQFSRSWAVAVLFIVNLPFFAPPFIDPIEVFDFWTRMLQHWFGPLTRPRIRAMQKNTHKKGHSFLQCLEKKSCFSMWISKWSSWLLENDVPFPRLWAMSLKFSQRMISFLPIHHFSHVSKWFGYSNSLGFPHWNERQVVGF